MNDLAVVEALWRRKGITGIIKHASYMYEVHTSFSYAWPVT